MTYHFDHRGMILLNDKSVLARTKKIFKRPCVVEATIRPLSSETNNINLGLFGKGFELRGHLSKQKVFEYSVFVKGKEQTMFPRNGSAFEQFRGLESRKF